MKKRWLMAALLALGFAFVLTGCIDANIVGKTFKVTFISEGEEYDSRDAALGSSVVFPETSPTKEADETYTYTFKGWSLTEGEDATPVESHIVVGDVTFYAVFSREEKDPEGVYFSVSFKDGVTGEKIGEDQKVKEGEDAILPTPPQHDGWEFIGWDRSHENITSKIEITAEYERKQYSLTRHVLGETKDESVEFESALALTAPEDVDSVFVFEGWYWDKNYDTPVETGAKMPADDAEMFAKYSIDFSGAEITTEGDLVYGKGDDFALVSGLKSFEGLSYTFMWNDGSAHEKFTLRNAGEYELSVTVTAAYGENVLTDTQEFLETVTVEKASLSVSVGLKADSVVYGTASEPSVTYGGFEYEDSQTSLDLRRYTYTDEDGNPVADNKLGVGTYSVGAEFAEPDNYVLEVTSATLTVTPKDLTVTVSAQNFVYGEIPEILLEFNGFVNGDGETSLGGGADYSYTKNGKPFTAEGLFGAGEYTVSVQGFTSENYKISYAGAASFTVSKREARAVLTAEGCVYGNNPEYNVKFTEILEEDKSLFVPEYSFTKDGEAYQPSGLFGAGKYEVTARFDANENYELNVVAAEFTVEKAELQIGVKVPSIVYGETPKPEITYDGFIEGESEAVLSGKAVYAYTKGGEPYDARVFVAGSYTVSVSDLTSENYDIAFADAASFEVAKTDLTLNVSVEKTSLVYGEKPVGKITPEGFVYEENMGNIGNPQAVFKNSEGVVVSDNVFHVGNYVATVEAQSENYNIIVEGTPFTVTRKDLTATVNLRQSSLTYGDQPEASVDYEGFISEAEEEQLTKNVVAVYTENDQKSDGSKLAVGKYVVSLEGLELSDYNVHVETAELTVSKKALTIDVEADREEYIYGETPELKLVFGEFAYDEDEKVLAGGSLSVSLDESPYKDEEKFIVGNYTAKAVGFTAENYAIEPGEINFTVAPKEVTVTVSADRAVYTFGDEVVVSLSVSALAFDETESVLGDMTVVYTKDGAPYTPAALFNAGEYTATVKSPSNENYNITVVQASFTVEKQVFAVSQSGSQKSGTVWTYTPPFAEDSPFVFEGTVRLKTTKEGTYTAIDKSSFEQNFEWVNGYKISYKDIDVTADFEITYHLSVTLNDSDFASITLPSETTVTYNGSSFEFGVTVQESFAKVEYSIDGGEFTTNIPSLTNAGTYSITYRVSAENYKTEEKSFEVTILKAENHIDYSGIGTTEFIYNGQNHTVDFSKATATDGTVAVSSETVFKDAGKYTVTLSVAESENYKAVSVEVTVKVAKADYEIVAKDQSYVYTGSAQGKGISVTALGEDKFTVLYDGNPSAPVLTNVGSVTVHYTVTGNNNYNDANETYDLSVTKAPNSIDVSSVTGTEWIYDGTEHVIDLNDVTAAFGEVTWGDHAFINAGTHKITLTVAGTDNYEGATATIEVVVHKAELTVTPQENNFTFNAQKQGNGVTVEALDAGYTTEYTYNNKKSDTVPQFVDAGSYKVDYRVSGANYKENTGFYTVTIAQKELTVINPGNQNKIYDGAEFGEEITVEGNVDDQYTVTYTVNGEPFEETPSFVDAGTYEITYTVSGNNYISVSDGYTITITKAQGTIDTSEVQTDYTYNGEEQVVDLGGVKWTRDGELSHTENKFTDVPEGGSFVITLTLSEGKNYFGETVNLTIKVNKADYEDITHPEIPEVVMGVGKTLESITLNEHFTWKEPSLALALGNNQYDAVYNADPKNYNDFALKITINARREKVTIAVDPLEADFGANELPEYKYTVYGEDGSVLTEDELLQLTLTFTVSDTNANFDIGSTYFVIYALAYDAENQYFELTEQETETYFKLKSVQIGKIVSVDRLDSNNKTIQANQSSIQDKNYYTIEDALFKANADDLLVITADTSFIVSGTKLIFADLYPDASYYTIKNSVTLLVPFETTEGEYSLYEQETMGPDKEVTTTPNSPSVKLILSDKLELKVYGNILINAVRGTSGTKTGNVANDKYGALEIMADSTVSLYEDAKFTCLGFAFGDGQIIAKNGSNVIETFVLVGWKGGTIGSAIYSTVFPFNQYSINNIICKITFDYGSLYTLSATATASGNIYFANVVFLGVDDKSFIQLSLGGKAVKQLNRNNGKINMDLFGDILLNNLSVSIGGVKLDTSKKQMPIPGNFKITLHAGNTVLNNVQIKLLPGAEFIVDKDAVLNIDAGGGLYLYGEYGNRLNEDTVDADGEFEFISFTGYTKKDKTRIYVEKFQDGGNGLTYPISNRFKTIYFDNIFDLGFTDLTPALCKIIGVLNINAEGKFAGTLSGESGGVINCEPGATFEFELIEDGTYYNKEGLFGLFGKGYYFKSLLKTNGIVDGKLQVMSAGNYTYTESGWVVAA